MTGKGESENNDPKGNFHSYSPFPGKFGKWEFPGNENLLQISDSKYPYISQTLSLAVNRYLSYIGDVIGFYSLNGLIF